MSDFTLESVLTGRTIVLGVGGSISAYKAADLCSKLTQEGASVLPILTPAALGFVGAATFWGLSGHPVASETAEMPFGAQEIAHLVYAERADIFVIAPASADLLARMANGHCDDMLTAALVANTKKPVLIAPAMNTDMWQHPATQRNRKILEGYGYQFIEPGVGRLAEGIVGAGRLAEPSEIVAVIKATLGNSVRDLDGVNLLITAGPTREAIDPVRYISNRSSGKMGYALAEAAIQRGATVVLVSGPTEITPPSAARLEWVTTAAQMHERALAYAGEADVIIAAAAVADYAPAVSASQKIKKGNDALLSLSLTPTADILAEMGRRKRAGQILIGFAAETEAVESNARAKLKSKNLDLIVANDVTRDGAGFDGDTNIVTLISRDGEPQNLPLLSKQAVADALCDWIVRFRQEKLLPATIANR